MRCGVCICSFNAAAFRLRVEGSGSGRGFRLRAQVQGSGSGFRLRVQVQGSVSGFRCRVQVQGSGSGFRCRDQVQGSGSGFRMQSAGSGLVWGHACGVIDGRIVLHYPDHLLRGALVLCIKPTSSLPVLQISILNYEMNYVQVPGLGFQRRRPVVTSPRLTSFIFDPEPSSWPR